MNKLEGIGMAVVKSRTKKGYKVVSPGKGTGEKKPVLDKRLELAAKIAIRLHKKALKELEKY